MSHEIDTNMVDAKLLTAEKQTIISYVYQRACERKPLPYILKKRGLQIWSLILMNE